MAGRSLTRVRGGVTDTIHINTDRFAGVRTMAATGKPLDDTTTSIQVTVAGHSDLDGVYTGSGADVIWTQQGGNGCIATNGYNSENGSQRWFVYDNDDFDPNGESNGIFAWEPTHVSLFPWSDLPSSHAVTITAVPKTITVNRTAPVVTSDHKGESRPLLSKVVGGAAAAYSLRDLNDKQGNNKVVRVRRSSDNVERDFLAKEVSNGTLEAWVAAGNDGFVSIWYDQSGNDGKDATQPSTDIQPKIVESGSLFADGLSFSPNRKINFPSDVLASTDFDLLNVFAVAKLNNTNVIQIGLVLDSSDFIFVPISVNSVFQV